MKLIPIPKKKKSLRAIDQGTRYDVTGKLRKAIREIEIESGDLGDVRDVVLIVSSENPGGEKSRSIHAYHFGTGTVADAHWMLATAKNRTEPA